MKHWLTMSAAAAALFLVVKLDGVVLLIAREMGIDVSELASVAYENLLARGKVETCLPTRLES